MKARLVVGGLSSGVGKTTTTLALARALAARGLRVALFKCGPDYLDPTYHARATGRPSHNIDGWMMGRAAVLSTFERGSRDADIAIVEGVMGLFDGASPTSDRGSTAEIAKWLKAPVLAVVDASGMARTVAAVAHGLDKFDPELRLAGVVCNRVGSKGHLALLRSASPHVPVVGGLPEEEALRFPERHLGLYAADERTLPDAVLDRWGELASNWIALDLVTKIAESAGPLPAIPSSAAEPLRRPCRIGVAWDEALHFYYDDNLRRLEGLGATLVRFSPVRDAEVPDVDGLYLGGGYPEAHAEALAANEAMRRSLRAFARRGGPVYAECGGLMVLAGSIRTLDGRSHAMAGVLRGEAVMKEKLVALGYVEVETQRPTILGAPGVGFRGHQFRYSELVTPAEAAPAAAYSVRRPGGGDAVLEGYQVDNVLASYVHAHWASNPLAARGFVESCVTYAGTRDGPGRR
ncbi:MAG: cobyrinate a,c-diamide synthase [Polyangiaceae bacterium]